MLCMWSVLMQSLASQRCKHLGAEQPVHSSAPSGVQRSFPPPLLEGLCLGGCTCWGLEWGELALSPIAHQSWELGPFRREDRMQLDLRRNVGNIYCLRYCYSRNAPIIILILYYLIFLDTWSQSFVSVRLQLQTENMLWPTLRLGTEQIWTRSRKT